MFADRSGPGCERFRVLAARGRRPLYRAMAWHRLSIRRGREAALS
jgi:hypothetical protein